MQKFCQDYTLQPVIVPIDKRGRFGIPAVFRNQLGINSCTQLEIFLVEDGILIRPVTAKNNNTQRQP